MKPYLLQHFLENSAERFPEKIAVKHGKEAITFVDLCAQAKALGAAIRKAAPGRGERVGIFLDKSIRQVVAILGVLYADKVFVLINSTLQKKQVIHILNDCSIDCLLAETKSRELLNGVLNEVKCSTVLWDEEITKALADHAGADVACENISDDVSNIIYTSGSTGMPKGIVLTHRNLIDGAKSVSEYLKITNADKLLGLLPFSFDYGLNQLTTSLYKGCTIQLYRFMLPNDLIRTLVEEKITGLAAMPPIWATVFDPRFCDLFKKDYDFSHLRYITNSGGKLPVPTVRKIREIFPKTSLYLMYGLTEAFRSTYLDPAEVDKRPDSIGKAIPNVEIEVVNENGERCKPNEPGELIHRGACIARGYWNNPEKTREVYRPNPLLPKESQFLETVVYSGDLVRKDEEGFLYFLGRRDHQIKTSGYRVSPTEVEALIMECRGVVEVVVFGLEDPTLGQRIRALVNVTNGIGPQDVINHCRAQAPYYLVPKEVFIVSEFLRTSSGKIDRPRMIEMSKSTHGV